MKYGNIVKEVLLSAKIALVLYLWIDVSPVCNMLEADLFIKNWRASSLGPLVIHECQMIIYSLKSIWWTRLEQKGQRSAFSFVLKFNSIAYGCSSKPNGLTLTTCSLVEASCSWLRFESGYSPHELLQIQLPGCIWYKMLDRDLIWTSWFPYLLQKLNKRPRFSRRLMKSKCNGGFWHLSITKRRGQSLFPFCAAILSAPCYETIIRRCELWFLLWL